MKIWSSIVIKLLLNYFNFTLPFLTGRLFAGKNELNYQFDNLQRDQKLTNFKPKLWLFELSKYIIWSTLFVFTFCLSAFTVGVSKPSCYLGQDKQTDKRIHKKSERKNNWQRGRETERQRDRETERQRAWEVFCLRIPDC